MWNCLRLSGHCHVEGLDQLSATAHASCHGTYFISGTHCVNIENATQLVSAIAGLSLYDYIWSGHKQRKSWHKLCIASNDLLTQKLCQAAPAVKQATSQSTADFPWKVGKGKLLRHFRGRMFSVTELPYYLCCRYAGTAGTAGRMTQDSGKGCTRKQTGQRKRENQKRTQHQHYQGPTCFLN